METLKSFINALRFKGDKSMIAAAYGIAIIAVLELALWSYITYLMLN